MKSLLSFLAVAFVLLTGNANAWDWEFTSNLLPEKSALRSQVKLEDKEEVIQAAIEKLIPIGTSEEEAAKLFAIHLPKPKKEYNFDREKIIPKEFWGKPYKCFRLFDSTSLRHVGQQWIEVVFFFENGKLVRTVVGRGWVSL